MRLQPGLLQLGNTLLAAGLSGQQLFQEVLVAGLVYAGVTEFGFYLCVFLVGASQLLLQFVSSLLQRRQALPLLCCGTRPDRLRRGMGTERVYTPAVG